MTVSRWVSIPVGYRQSRMESLRYQLRLAFEGMLVVFPPGQITATMFDRLDGQLSGSTPLNTKNDSLAAVSFLDA